MNYQEWIQKQPEAIQDIKKIIKFSKNIPDLKNKKRYLKKEKHEFETKWTKKYANRNANSPVS